MSTTTRDRPPRRQAGLVEVEGGQARPDGHGDGTHRRRTLRGPPAERAIVDDAREWAADRVDHARGIIERHGTIFRWMWIATGFVVVVAGLAMIVFPGPVTIVVPLGLAMLAAVFGWARTALLRTVDYGEAATRRFQDASRPVKALTVAASMCIAAAVIAWFVL